MSHPYLGSLETLLVSGQPGQLYRAHLNKDRANVQHWRPIWKAGQDLAILVLPWAHCSYRVSVGPSGGQINARVEFTALHETLRED